MHFQKLLGFFAAFLTVGMLSAQDIHFTQYNMSPMTLNPAQIGKFEGSVRIGGIYRGQWASVVQRADQFQTPSVWIDAPIIRGFRKRDWVGLGLMFFSDKAGELSLKHNAQKLGASYHLALDKKANTVLSIGAHYGSESRSTDYQDARFGDGILNGTLSSSPDYSSLRNAPKVNYKDIDAGLMLSSKLNKQMDFQLGFSMYHLFEPKFTLLKDTSSMGGGGSVERPLDRRGLLHGTFNIKTNDRLTLSPTFLYQFTGPQQEIALQGMAGYLFDPERDITLNFGVGYRFGDALQALLGAKYKDLRIGFAYDINNSSLVAASNYRGGFELAANYIIKIYKPAVVKPKVLCPRF